VKKENIPSKERKSKTCVNEIGGGKRRVFDLAESG
jgi:hypothetical protein